MQYVLEVQGWVDWEQVKTFDSLEIAEFHAKEVYSHNTWRIIDGSDVVCSYDPSSSIEKDVSHDLQRFASTERWMAQRASSQRLNQRQMMRTVAVRQRRPSRPQRDMLDMDLEELLEGTSKKPKEKINWLKQGF